MAGELQPDVGDDLDRAVFQLKTMWFGLLSGGLVFSSLAIALVTSRDEPVADLGALAYLLFLPIAVIGLFAAFLLPPRATPKDPPPAANPGNKLSPDDTLYWFPLYTGEFILRAGMLEGTAITQLLGFFLTGNWVLLAAALGLIAALAVQLPSRATAEAFAESARARRTTGG